MSKHCGYFFVQKQLNFGYVKMIQFEQVKEQISSIEEMATWSEIDTIFAAHQERVPAAWQLPAYSCYAVGADELLAVPAVAAMGCLQKSIILVDDMLDDETDALFRSMGSGRAANLSMALQAASTFLLSRCRVPAELREAAQRTLAQLVIQTTVGQERDVQHIEDESDYWRVVQGKSVPFYAEGFRLGAQLGGATHEQETVLAEIGGLFGEVIQIHDDLEDAFAVPATPDWQRRQNNLLILYGITADYSARRQFMQLAQQTANVDSLRAAQQILIESGAVSYALYQAIARENQVYDMLEQAELPRPQPIRELFIRHRTPLVHFLKESGINEPESLFSMRETS